jgi:hypothetical protein
MAIAGATERFGVPAGRAAGAERHRRDRGRPCQAARAVVDMKKRRLDLDL